MSNVGENKMSKDYDCRMYCLNLYQMPIGKRKEGTTYNDNCLGYYCKLTDKRCVGSKWGIFVGSDNKLDTKIVERCPGRKTIDDIIIETPDKILKTVSNVGGK